MTYAPIALFIYNRLEHTQRTIQALKQNILAKDSDLIIFSDAAKNEGHLEKVSELRLYICEIEGFKSIKIVERTENFGLARSIIDGVTSVVNEHESIIVLEDDMVTSPYFLNFMNDGLNLYKNNNDVASIHAYVYPINDLQPTFFMRGADCWGWATWKDRWTIFEPDGSKLLSELTQKKLTKRFDFNGAYPFVQMLRDQIAGKNDSWAIRWHASVFLQKKFTLYPGKSLVLNIGNDGSGSHCGITDRFSSETHMSPIGITSIAVVENSCAFQMFERYFRKQRGGLLGRVGRLVAGMSRKLN